MTDPYAILGVRPEAEDETIRNRYLELVKQFPPEQQPERFAAIRQAYESVRDLEKRLHYLVFEAGRKESPATLIEELKCRSPRRRLSLQALLALVQTP